MVLLVLSDKHKEDLHFLTEVDDTILLEFSKLAVQFLKNGSNPKVYSGAAAKLEVKPDVVRNSVEGLSFLFTAASRQNLSAMDFIDSILLLQFSAEVAEEMKSLYEANKKEFRSLLSELAFSLPHYDNCEWRLDVQIASRSLHNQMNPVYIIRLETLNPERKVHYLQSDYANLKHVVETLQQGLKEAKSGHCRRIMRNVK